MQQSDIPLIPVRMLNEFNYCPRLAYLEWVQQEFTHNEYTIEGSVRHKRVDQKTDSLLIDQDGSNQIHARSVTLSSDALGIVAKLDLIEGEGSVVSPVDYKQGKRPHIPTSVYDPDRVQICAQALLLRENGFDVTEGFIYFCESRERVRIDINDDLLDLTLSTISNLKAVVTADAIPTPLENSPKCPRCSLVGICLPDEVRFLSHLPTQPRPIYPPHLSGQPLYIQSPRAFVRKDGERLVIEEEKVKVAETRLGETSQVVLFGNAILSTPALHECLRRDIPVTWLSYGGWFMGHTVGTGHKNVETRTHQYRTSFDEKTCLDLAKRLVVAKIANCRTLLRRNWKMNKEEKSFQYALVALKEDMRHAMKAGSIESLLGTEGIAANRYFQHFSGLLVSGNSQSNAATAFDFLTRNRRPPKDPVNALLSFAYSMLVREWTITLASVGLDPYRGFYHQPRFGRPALALDIMEPFRPLVADSAVIMAINNGEVKADDFVISVAGCNLKEPARKRFIGCFERRLSQEATHPIFGYKLSYRKLFEVQSRLLIRYLSGEIPIYPNFVTR